MTIFLVSVVIVIIASTANSQDCRLYTTAQLETLLSSSITVEPNTVCLASGTQRDTYQEASVVVTLNGVVRQVELSCSSSTSTWGVTTNNLASADATSPLRRDCASCAASSGDTSLDNVTHCIPCLEACTGLRQCTSFMASDCCNYYDNDTCTRTCPAGTDASASTGYSCIDPCSDNPCSNNGNCSASGVEFSCSCAGSWSGPRCQTCDIADCTACSQARDVCSQCRSGLQLLSSGACACTVRCGSGGVLDDSQCQCNCSLGFTGDTCSSKCVAENCRTCSNNSLDICNACVDGYELENNGATCSRTGTFIGPLSLGALIGIIAAAVVVALLLMLIVCLCCYCLCCRRGSQKIV